MLEYRTISNFNPRPRPTCDSPDNSSGPRKPWKKCVLYTHTFNEERFKWDLFVLLILSCLHVSVVKNYYIKRLAASLFLASIFHATSKNHEPCMHCILLQQTYLYLWIPIPEIYPTRQTFDILWPVECHTVLEKPSCLAPTQLQLVNDDFTCYFYFIRRPYYSRVVML